LHPPFIVSGTFKSPRLNSVDRVDENTFAQIALDLREEKRTDTPDQ
jgi:hypothetical protein